MDMQIIKLADSEELISIENHFKVMAGPGSGKTHWLVNHIKNVLRNSTRLLRNKKIACITYTNVGVDTIKKRLNESDENIEISTIHSFLYKHIVKPYFFLIKDKYEVDYKKMDGPIEHYISQGWFSKTALTSKKIKVKELSKIYWKIEKNECVLHIRDRKAKFHSDLIKYKTNFWKMGIIHYEDVLGFAWEIIKTNEDVLRVIRAKFPYFFIDEFQDTSPIQAEIIKLLGENETIVGIIGDKAQSIYKFQGADVAQFDSFLLDNMKLYKIENNHRSTEQIIKILNNLRIDLVQESPEKKQGIIPIIFVGDKLKALSECEKLCGEKNIATLSYANVTSNEMKNKNLIESSSSENLLEKIMEVDTNSARRKFLISSVRALELVRNHYIKDGLQEIKKYFKDKPEYDSLHMLKDLLEEYDKFNDNSFYEFYQRLYDKPFFKISKLTDKAQACEFYKSIKYREIALWVNLKDEKGLHRTIHKSKGDEFENVLLIIEGQINKKFNEDIGLKFIFFLI